MRAYHDLVRQVLQTGVWKPNARTKLMTQSAFALNFRHNMADGFPLLTTKRMAWKGILYELCWFLCGDTNIKALRDRDVKIWNEWANPQGDVGPIYGAQWTAYRSYRDGGAINQLSNVLETLRNKPSDRRGIVTAWNPADIPFMGLPPCHHVFQLLIHDDRLCCHMTQRSADLALGVPFNIASYALLLMLAAKHIGRTPSELAITFVDCHLYAVAPDDPQREEVFRDGILKKEFDQIGPMHEQLERSPRPLPTLEILAEPGPFDIFEWARECLYNLERPAEEFIRLSGYDPYPPIKMAVAV